jgi:hypothetical protein
MLMPCQFHLDAFKQPTPDAIQRPAYTLSEPLQSVGDFYGVKLFNVTQLKQFVVFGAKLFLAAPQGSQIHFYIIAMGLGRDFCENISQLLGKITGRVLMPQEIADLDFRYLACPGKETGAGLKRSQLSPKN